MNILILGSGGREHAIAWKVAQSKYCDQLYVSPGNGGTSAIAKNVVLNDFQSISQFVLNNNVELLVIGPEAPLVEGIVDYLKADEQHQGLAIIGPDKKGAQLEGSKDFAKEFMKEFDVPTAKYRSFTKATIEEGFQFLEELKPPYVLKADGLAAGKGVLIIDDLESAKEELGKMLIDSKFGKASEQVVIEEYLDGIEMSVFVLTDGEDYLVLPEAKDYKRIGEGDTGLNTGGMGAISPVPFVNVGLREKIEERIIKPTIKGIKERGFDYKGFVFIGLMIVDQDPFVIEYNVRMGDPETEVVMPRIKSDLLQHLMACTKGNLSKERFEIDKRFATTVMLVSGGYPESYEKGKVVYGLDKVKEGLAFHAGTTNDQGKTLTNGGRVLTLTSQNVSLQEALNQSFNLAEQIEFEGKYYRKDIGFDLLI